MNTLPTAEEFMTDEYQIKNYGTILLKPHQSAIEFAKLHVKAALEAANKNVNYKDFKYTGILDAYPLNLIK